MTQKKDINLSVFCDWVYTHSGTLAMMVLDDTKAKDIDPTDSEFYSFYAAMRSVQDQLESYGLWQPTRCSDRIIK